MQFFINPYPADHDYCRFYFVLLGNKITVIRNVSKYHDLQLFVLKLNKYD